MNLVVEKQTRSLVAENNERRYQEYEKNKRFEEETDIAERIGYPIDVSIYYQLHEDGLYAKSDSRHRPFHEQTREAKQRGLVNFTGDQAFEYTRLSHEHDEALMADAFARGELGGNVMIKLSRVPDAVATNQTDIRGYRRDLLRSFVRIYYRDESEVTCRLYSLDGNHQVGLERVGNLLDIEIGNKSSEDILADVTLIDVPPQDLSQFVEGIVQKTKQAYDREISMSRGEVTHAGSLLLHKDDAHQLVRAQSRLVDQHMAAISSIQAAGLGDDMLEIERQRTAAAIKLAIGGAKIGSNSDTVVSSEVSQGNYGRECATATGMNQAVATSEFKSGKCRVCLARTKVGACSVCASCEMADNRGIDLRALHKEALVKQNRLSQKTKATLEPVSQPQKLSKNEQLQLLYGKYATMRFETTIGGADVIIFDRRTGEILIKNGKKINAKENI